MIKRLALEWYCAEHGGEASGAEKFFSLSGEDLAKVMAHVERVLNGDVRRSEATAGDLAIWEGRFRATRLTPPRPGKVGEIRDVSWMNYWDSIDVSDFTRARDYRLFGNANVGQLALTNLQVAGMVSYDNHAFGAEAWYVTLNFNLALDAYVEEFLQNTIATLLVGDRVEAQLSAFDLIMPSRLNFVIPPRQNISIGLSSFGEAALKLKVARVAFGDIGQMMMRVHLEGWKNRSVR